MLLSISGCASISATECVWVELIEVSRDDTLTRGTQEQIVQHNTKVERFCK